MSLDVPEAVAAYLAAEKAKNVDLLDRCFASDAVVRDGGHDHRGLDAIKQWKREADAKYQFLTEPLAASTEGNVVTVRARVSGAFSGSPVDLNFHFTLANEKVVALQVLP